MQIGTMISGFRNTEIYGYGRGQRGRRTRKMDLQCNSVSAILVGLL